MNISTDSPTSLLVGLLLFVATSVIAAPPPIVTEQRGQLPACVQCHGIDGRGDAQLGSPRLAGLNPEYIVKQLRDFQTHRRQSDVMAVQAQGLTVDEIDMIAAYYANLKSPSVKIDVTPQQVSVGKNLAIRGNWDKNVPACFRCHGDQGRGVAPHMPALAGQHKSYLVAQLQAWKSGKRSNDPLSLMATIAQRMDDNEIDAVATYIASLPATRTSTDSEGNRTP